MLCESISIHYYWYLAAKLFITNISSSPYFIVFVLAGSVCLSPNSMALHVNEWRNGCRNEHFVYLVISLSHTNARHLINDVLRRWEEIGWRPQMDGLVVGSFFSPAVAEVVVFG